MHKPSSLREFLVAAIPQLANDPDRLSIYIENGRAVSTMAPGLSWEYRYTLEVFLTDFAGTPDAIMAPLVAWMRTHQPDTMANPDLAEQAIQFEADILNNDTVDLSIRLALTERAICTPRDDTSPGYQVTHPEEPQFEPRLEAKHWQIYANDDLIAEWDQPEA